jgi:hypothetical protein
VVVSIVPIVVGTPAVLIFVPPAMAVIPAMGARLREFIAPMLSLGAVRAVVFDGLVQFVVCIDGALLTIVFRTYQGSSGEQQGPQIQDPYRTYLKHFSALLSSL